MEQAEVPTALIRVRRALVWLVAAEVLLLAVGGTYLAFFYRPSAAQAWNDIYGLQEEVGFANWVRSSHAVIAWVTVASTFVLAAVAFAEGIVRWNGPIRRRSGLLAGPAAAVLVLVGLATGPLLHWDQLALRAVTVGTDLSGFRPIFDGDQVRFVLIGGSEVSVGTFRTVFLIHALALPVLLGVVLWVLRRRGRGEVAAAPVADRAAAAPALDRPSPYVT